MKSHKQCSICPRKYKGLGYCEMHLDRLNRTGNPLLGGRKPSNVLADGRRVCDGCKEPKPPTEFYRHPVRGYYERYCHPCRKKKQSIGHVRRKYGEEGAKFAARIQDGEPCEICGKPAFVIDHDHDTDAPVGILCMNCNSAIGQLGDSVEMIQIALDYVRRTRG